MAKKKANVSTKGMWALNFLFVMLGIYLVVIGVLPNDSQNWQAFFVAAGLGLTVTGTIGFSKL